MCAISGAGTGIERDALAWGMTVQMAEGGPDRAVTTETDRGLRQGVTSDVWTRLCKTSLMRSLERPTISRQILCQQ